MMLTALLVAAAAAPSAPADAKITLVPECTAAKADEILVCAPGRSPYRIDEDELAAIRQREAPPPKPEPDANVAAANAGANGCIGGEGKGCKGGVVPLVAMGLAAAKAAALAAQGDDWRKAIRTQDDEYSRYLAQKRRRDEARKPKFGISVK